MDRYDVEKDPGVEAQEPWFYRVTRVSHYYGDTTRQIFLVAAALILLGAPFYADDLQVQLPFVVVCTVALVAFAAFTSPRSRLMILADAVLCVAGLIFFELWALSAWNRVSATTFFLREIIAFLFLFGLYFSGKSWRAVLLGEVGEPKRYATFPNESEVDHLGSTFRADDDQEEPFHRNEKPEDKDN